MEKKYDEDYREFDKIPDNKEIPKSLSDAAIEAIQSTKGAVAIVVASENKVVFSHRFDMVFSMSNVTSDSLAGLASNAFYRLLNQSFCLARQELLEEDKRSLLYGTSLEYSFPSNKPLLADGGLPYAIIRHTSTSVILQHENGQPNSLATINTYEKTDGHIGHLNHTTPLIKREGAILSKETRELIRKAGVHIFNGLDFTSREWDILERLVHGVETSELHGSLKISPHTVEDYFKSLRKKCREISPELTPRAFAPYLVSLSALS